MTWIDPPLSAVRDVVARALEAQPQEVPEPVQAALGGPRHPEAGHELVGQ